MSPPPEFLRTVLDGGAQSSLIVQSNGSIWHMNTAARRLFQTIGNSIDEFDVADAQLSTYLVFSNTTHGTSPTSPLSNRETLQLSWEEVIHRPELFVNDKRKVDGIVMPEKGCNFPVDVNIVSVREGITAANQNGDYDNVYYCLYISTVDVQHAHQNMMLQVDSEASRRISKLSDPEAADTLTELQLSMALQSQKNIIGGFEDASFDAMFVIDEHGIIQQVNKASIKVFGWRRKEFVGKNISMIMKGDDCKHHDEYLQNYLKTGIKRMIGTQREVTAQRKDKTTFPCILGLSQIKDDGLFCGFIRDISQEKAAETKLIKNNNHMEGIINASFDAMFVISERGIINKVNDAASTVFGWTKEDFIGQTINTIMPECHAVKHDSYLEHYIATGFKKMIGTQREVEAKRKDGTCFPCTLGIAELSYDGNSEREFVGFIRDVTVQKSLLVAEAERRASDTLLENVFPEHIAHRLKKDPGHIADHYDNTTILFADIVGFTDRATKMSPHDVVTMLNDLFSRFDLLVDHYDLNKVKTIGDCYMVTSIPSNELGELDGRAGCSRVCQFALDLLLSVQEFNLAGPQHGQLELRIGIAIGQVVAGVVGTKRFLFDMWGDAVNVAARMEQHGLAGQIQVTKEVVNSVCTGFNFEGRGKQEVKGKGILETFLLKSAKKKFSPRRSSQYNRWKPIPTPPATRSNSTMI